MRARSQMEWLVDGCIGRTPVTEILRSKIEVGTAKPQREELRTPVTEVLRSKIEVGTAKSWRDT